MSKAAGHQVHLTFRATNVHMCTAHWLTRCGLLFYFFKAKQSNKIRVSSLSLLLSFTPNHPTNKTMRIVTLLLVIIAMIGIWPCGVHSLRAKAHKVNPHDNLQTQTIFDDDDDVDIDGEDIPVADNNATTAPDVLVITDNILGNDDNSADFGVVGDDVAEFSAMPSENTDIESSTAPSTLVVGGFAPPSVNPSAPSLSTDLPSTEPTLVPSIELNQLLQPTIKEKNATVTAAPSDIIISTGMPSAAPSFGSIGSSNEPSKAPLSAHPLVVSTSVPSLVESWQPSPTPSSGVSVSPSLESVGLYPTQVEEVEETPFPSSSELPTARHPIQEVVVKDDKVVPTPSTSFQPSDVLEEKNLSPSVEVGVTAEPYERIAGVDAVEVEEQSNNGGLLGALLSVSFCIVFVFWIASFFKHKAEKKAAATPSPPCTDLVVYRESDEERKMRIRRELELDHAEKSRSVTFGRFAARRQLERNRFSLAIENICVGRGY